MNAYLVKNNKDLKVFNEFFKLNDTNDEMYCYPALYVQMFDTFIAVNINKITQYHNIGYKIFQIKKRRNTWNTCSIRGLIK